jgi:hypothetical protein
MRGIFPPAGKGTLLRPTDYARTAGFGDPFAKASNCMSRSRSTSMSLSGIMFGPSDGARSGS